MKVHDILRRLRRDRNLTQQNLADELGIDITTYNRYEKEGGNIQLDMLERIAKFYDLTVHSLLSYSEKKGPGVEEPQFEYVPRDEVTVLVKLDGQAATLERWIKKLRKLNAAAS